MFSANRFFSENFLFYEKIKKNPKKNNIEKPTSNTEKAQKQR